MSLKTDAHTFKPAFKVVRNSGLIEKGGVAGALQGLVRGAGNLAGGLANSLKGSVSAGAVLAGGLSFNKALAGVITGGATFTSALTGAGGVMPTGASVIYYADQATTQTNGFTYVPNAANPVASSLNLFPSPRRMFAGKFWDAGNGLSVTDSGFTAPDGTNEASRLQCTVGGGNWYLGSRLYPNGGSLILPAGTYTLGVNVRWRGTGSASFSLGAWSSQLTTKTATSTWGRYSAQVTSNGTGSLWLMMFNADGGAAGCDFEVCDFNLFAGSSDLGATSGTDTNLYLHKYETGATTAYSMSGNAIDLSVAANGGVGTFALPADTTFGACTMIAVTKRGSGSGANASFHPIFSGYKGGTNQWRQFCMNTGSGDTDAAEMYIAGGTKVSMKGNFIDHPDNGWEMRAFVTDGSTGKMYGNDVELHSASATTSAQVERDLILGRLQDAFYSTHSLFAFAIYNRALSAAEVATAYAALSARAASKGITFATRKIGFIEGDSIAADATFANAGIPSTTVGPMMHTSLGVGGSTVSGAVSRASALDAYLPAQKNGKIYVLTVFLGANDLQGVTGENTSFTSSLASYLDARKAAGWDKVIACTVIDRTLGSISGSYAIRATEAQAANTTIRTWVGVHCDAIADFAADANLTPNNSNANNTTYYGDGLHPTAAGHALMGAKWATAFNTL